MTKKISKRRKAVSVIDTLSVFGPIYGWGLGHIVDGRIPSESDRVSITGSMSVFHELLNALVRKHKTPTGRRIKITIEEA